MITTALLITSIVYVKVLPGREADFVREAQRLINPSRNETGNVAYYFQQSETDPSEMTFFERWQSQSALDAHLQQPYFMEFASRVQSMYAPGYPRFEKYRAIE
ncbi:MAG: antibiotic biosynthesis monooxygenase [Bdellovibrionales bacterium]|nr:antibiotic biosynthesis monooxygenase [Bdellovibrionales bacterium]